MWYYYENITGKSGKMIFNNAEKIIDYSSYLKQINAIKFDYVMAKESLKDFSYTDAYTPACKKKYMDYIYNYKKVMIDVLKKTLKMFAGFLKDYKYIVVLNGSFARNSYREFSDLDVTLILDKKKTKQYVIFEELFYYALSYILGLGRERIHSVFNRFYNVEKQKKYDDEVVISWDDVDKKIAYVVKDNFAYEMHLALYSERSYGVLMQNLTNQLSQDVLYHNAYCYDVVFNNTEYDLENDIMASEFRNRSTFSLPSYDKAVLALRKSYVSRDLKLVIKDVFMNELLEFASYVRHYLVRRQNYRKLLNLNEVLDSETFGAVLGKYQKKLKDNYFEYLFYLTRVEMCLKDVGIELSSHDLTPIDCAKLLSYYQVKFNTKENVLQKLLKIATENREIYKVVLATI